MGDTPVRVFLHDSDGLRPAVIPSRSEVLTAAAGTGLRTTAEHDLGDLRPLVKWVTSWADGHWALAKVKRPSYQAWHCAGRQVLKVARFKGGVQITAGVNYSKNPPAGEEKALSPSSTMRGPFPAPNWRTSRRVSPGPSGAVWLSRTGATLRIACRARWPSDPCRQT